MLVQQNSVATAYSDDDENFVISTEKIEGLKVKRSGVWIKTFDSIDDLRRWWKSRWGWK